ncbi:MFS transporter [Streptomyces zingiberis]|uniref:MFS transporter n=1 Tax=Streptomyces zingiberis TaxID=2053010 RepID=A0ABX1C557_9ACTN|nr:MFS transporter [Streptomyces zingiberis]NJQ03052.1 MFS transporter [Streptomyces zingiberis]
MWRSLSGAQRALLAGGLLVNIGTFAVYPYLAVLLRERLGAGMAQVGLVLGAATLVQFAGAPFTAAFAERVGLKRALTLATCLYGLGALAYLGGVAKPALMVAGLFLSCGAGALYSPAYRGYLVHSATAGQRPGVLSAGNAAGHLGIALGPVAGALFLHRPALLFTLSAALYAVLTAGHLLLRPERPERPDGGGRAAEPFRRVLRGLASLPFTVTVVTHYLYTQFYQYLAVFTEGRLATAVHGLIMMGYSLGLAVFQPLLARRTGAARYPVAMAVGFGCMAAGMAAFATGRAAGVAAGAVALSAGTAVLFLKNDLEALALSDRSATVTFGRQRLAVGVGTSLGGLIGGALYGWFERVELLPGFWLALAVQCLLLPPLVLVVARRTGRAGRARRADPPRRAGPVTPAGPAVNGPGRGGDPPPPP